MSSSSKKGKLGGKKLSANEQLLALQDALTLGVSELQLAAQRLGDHWITMSTLQKEEERVVDFKVQVCTYLHALGIDMLRKLEDQKRIINQIEALDHRNI